MLRKSSVLAVGLAVAVVAAVAGYRSLAASMRTQSFFFRVVTKRPNPDVMHTVGVVAPNQLAAEDLALDYAENTWGGTGWYVSGTPTNHGEVHVNLVGAQ